MPVVIIPSHRGGSGGREFASPVMSRRPHRRCGLQRDPVGHQAWPASRQRQKRTSGTLGPRWAVGAEPDQFHRAGPSRLDARRAPLPDRASQHTDAQDGGRKLLWMLSCDLRDGLRISCPAKEPALRALCASTGSPGPIGVAVRRPLLTETSRARDAPVVAIGSTWRSSPCVTARRSLGG